MIYAGLFAYDCNVGDEPWYQYSCVGCGEVLDYGDEGLLRWLERNNQQLFCDTCDPLPDVIPPALSAKRVTVGDVVFDVIGSMELGVPLVLLTINSQS